MLLKGVFSKAFGKYIVGQNLCFLRQRPQILAPATCNGTCILPEICCFRIRILGFKMSSQVKSDPAILKGSKKRSWSQNLRSLSQKTKILTNNVLSRSFGKYSFQRNQGDRQVSALSKLQVYFPLGGLIQKPCQHRCFQDVFY